jgi:hypothetical protein
MKMPKNVDLSKSINREKVIEPSIANNEKNIECPPLLVSKTDFFGKWTSSSVTSLLRHKRHVVKKMTGDHRTYESSLRRGALSHTGQPQLHDVAAGTALKSSWHGFKEQVIEGQCCGS